MAIWIVVLMVLVYWWWWWRPNYPKKEPLRPDPALKQKGKSCYSCKNIAFCANTACSTHHTFCTFCIFCTLHYSALQSTSCLVCIIQHWKAMLSCSASKLSLGNFMISFYVCIPSVSTVFIHFDFNSTVFLRSLKKSKVLLYSMSDPNQLNIHSNSGVIS